MNRKKQLDDDQLHKKFMEDIANISITTESDFEDSYYHLEKQRIEKEMLDAKKKASQRKTYVLEEIKNDQLKNKQFIQEFQDQMGQVAKITKGQQKNVIDQTKLQEIKKQIVQKKPKIVLSDEVLKETVNIRKSVIFQKQSKKKIQQQKSKQQQLKIQNKMEKMFQERQLLQMARQDNYSTKYQEDYHSNLLSGRFYTPIINNVYRKNPIIQLNIPQPCLTYTNLCPQINNQDNVLSKHSKIIAYKNLSMFSKINLTVQKKQTKKIELVEVQIVQNQKSQVCFNIQKKNSTNKGLNLVKIIKQYFSTLVQPAKYLESISKKPYNPKIINQYLQFDEKGINIDLDNKKIQQKPLQKFLQQLQNEDRIKQLKLTFENLKDIKNIKKLKSLQYIQFQYNKLTQVQQLKFNNKLIQLNISNNMLKSYQGIQNLKWLRYINLQNNKISKMNKFDQEMLMLEYLNLKNNKIQIIQGLQNVNNLRKLNLANNSIIKIQGLQKLYFLNFLNLSYNKIQSINNNLSKCILLKNLLLNNNQISAINQPLILIFLSQLNLNSNKLTKINNDLVMPSLEYLYLENNKLVQSSQFISYLPNLKVINIDNNKLSHFCPIWNILKYSNLIQIIKYDNNQQLSFIPQKVKQLYEHMIYRKMKNLKILNQSEFNVGLKRYYQSIYDILLQPYKQQTINRQLSGLQEKISFMLTQNKFLQWIQKNNQKFSKNRELINYKSSSISKNMLQIIKFVKQQKQYYFQSYKSLFYKYDLFTETYKISLHKIRGLVIRFKYKKNKKKIYFQKNKQKINKLLKVLHQKYLYFHLYQTISKFKLINLTKFVIKIQKVWRGYRLRKKMKALLKNIKSKRVDDDLQQFQQPDLDFFYQPVEQYQLKFPQNMTIPIIRPQVFVRAEQAIKRPPINSNNSNYNNNKDSKGGKGAVRNNFMGESKMSNLSKGSSTKKSLPPIVDKKEQQKKIMQDWGFKNEATVIAMQYKAQRKRKMQQKQRQKNMTAAQRYQRFRQNRK